jgi:hypothetical protein
MGLTSPAAASSSTLDYSTVEFRFPLPADRLETVTTDAGLILERREVVV